MGIVFDPAKDRINKTKHGVSLERTKDMEVAVVLEDTRFDYGERRFRAFGYIDGAPHCLVFALRGNDVRAISLRRARLKEIERYGAEKQES
jgi:uncharacterized DUF497 family protein